MRVYEQAPYSPNLGFSLRPPRWLRRAAGKVVSVAKGFIGPDEPPEPTQVIVQSPAGPSGIDPKVLMIGGAALAGLLLVTMMRKGRR